MERSCLVCDGDELRADDLPPEIRGTASSGVAVAERPYKDARRDFERNYFLQLLASAEGNIQKAAELAGIHRSTLYEKLAALQIAVERE
jgi:transcriptional regulator of acetoin/glycerol metabolism